MNQEERRQRRQKDTKSAVIVCVIVVLILLVLVAGGVFLVGRLLPKGGGQNEGTDGTELPGENVAATEEVTEQPQTEVQTDPVEEQAAQLVSQMTLEDKIAQMFVITPNALTGYASGVTAAGDTTKEAYQSRPVGGIVYMADNLTDPEQTTTMLSNMQEIARERTGLPVFLCVDEEGGSVARIAGNDAFGVTDVGNMSDIGASGDVQNAYNAGSTIGSYLAALGFNVDFAPVADVLTNPDNQVLGQRSFGSDAQTVAGMVTSELQGLSAAGVYGAVSTDKTLEELMAEELVPFQSAIDGGVNFVMVGHISAPNVTGDNAPATLSKVLITDVLRGQMGYNGIVITDAMNMEAITGFYNSDKAAVLAVTAGADMILMPADYNTAYTGILNAVNDGTITEERINESVTRIVKAKLAMGQP